MIYFVTGPTGFIGKRLAKKLLQRIRQLLPPWMLRVGSTWAWTWAAHAKKQLKRSRERTIIFMSKMITEYGQKWFLLK